MSEACACVGLHLLLDSILLPESEEEDEIRMELLSGKQRWKVYQSSMLLKNNTHLVAYNTNHLLLEFGGSGVWAQHDCSLLRVSQDSRPGVTGLGSLPKFLILFQAPVAVDRNRYPVEIELSS